MSAIHTSTFTPRAAHANSSRERECRAAAAAAAEEVVGAESGRGELAAEPLRLAPIPVH